MSVAPTAMPVRNTSPPFGALPKRIKEYLFGVCFISFHPAGDSFLSEEARIGAFRLAGYEHAKGEWSE